MKIENQDLMQEFYDLHIREKYPTLDFQRCKEICSGPWQYLKEQTENGNLPTIRLKYFGTFVVYPKRVTAILERITKRQRKHHDTEKFLKKKEIILKYLDNEGSTG